MSHRIPFLEELKQELIEHAPPRTEAFRAPVRRRVHLRGAWAAAAAFMVVLLIGGLGWALRGDAPPETTVAEPVTELGPELAWQQVDAPEGVNQVRDLWSLPDGFALWTGEQVWTSTDGQDWQLAASDPPVTDTNHPRVAAQLDSEWLVAGTSEDGSPVVAATSNGSSWTPVTLPLQASTNELLASRIEVVALVSGPDGVVAVGALTTGVDEEAVIARYAPDLTGSEIRYRDNSIDILEADGSVGISVPFADIDERLAEQRGVILDTIIWFSPDAQSWDQVDFIEDAGPGFLGANSSNYTLTLVGRASRLTRVLMSNNGVDWDRLTELQEPVLGPAAALFEQELIAGGQNVSLVGVRPDGATRLISTGPAFDDNDLQDLAVGQVAAGQYGVVVAAYDQTRENVPYLALWYSPDGQRWNRQNTSEIFGSEVNLQLAVGADRAIVATNPEGEAGLPLEIPFQIWIGTIGK